MSPEQHKLLEICCRQELNQPLAMSEPIGLGGHDTLECFWCFNDLFRPRLHQIKTVTYRKKYEKAADKAIHDLITKGADWSELPLVVWRVLLERHQQAIMLCIANAVADNPAVIFVPKAFSAEARAKFAIVFLWYAMKLPYKVTDESALDIDAPFAHLNDRLH